MQGVPNPLSISFINFTKAFDSIHRPFLWNIMWMNSLPPKVISVIGKSTQIQVLHKGWRRIQRLVRGCNWDPPGMFAVSCLLALAIDWLLKKATKDQGTQWLEGQKLSDLDFVDNIAAKAETMCTHSLVCVCALARKIVYECIIRCSSM